ncbi:MAG: hypothetical protein QGF33_04775 [Alphaproteobacteria bacterium]|nr:hypothetical protein [Alphaproteobacteria bacterium]MEC7514704.1 hypothetical protein [Pseudomonadota bacterium]MEC7676699.1 hypothetical protein [Pseudomonadota bacterium]MEC8084597.1 hypothetical protein [Pseudomonadota bacterium]MEC8116055.1 hypothetical protein [Pseudomonadota bacterium]|tara:strand:+ start:181 stop:516 length:336 start_codon:yes stop_codon:yes gene_type:complete
MRKSAILKAAAMAAITATVASPVSADPGAERGDPAAKVCARHDAMTKHLSVSYAEQPLNLALDANGNMVEVNSSNQGSWTMVVITPAGVACVVATGEAWISLNPRPPGDRT